MPLCGVYDTESLIQEKLETKSEHDVQVLKHARSTFDCVRGWVSLCIPY